MSKKHSTVSPSSCERFWNCPGSVRLCKGRPNISGASAKEGTFQHAIAEKCLLTGSYADDYVEDYIEFGHDKESRKVDQKQAELVNVYLDAIDKVLAEEGMTRADIHVEHKFQLAIDEEARGSADCWFIGKNTGTLYVWDYKSGRGEVPAEENKQMMYYAAGVVEASLLVEDVVLVIVQPVSAVAPVKIWKTTANRITQFTRELKEHIDATRAEEAPVNGGAWCKYCAANKPYENQPVCPAFQKDAVKTFKTTETTLYLPLLETITDENLPVLLAQAEDFEALYGDWLQGLKERALTLATSGVTVEGYFLKQKQGNRKWIDERDVIERFGEAAYDKPKVMTPAKLEKLLKDKEAIETLTTREDKGFELVRSKETVKRINRFQDETKEV